LFIPLSLWVIYACAVRGPYTGKVVGAAIAAGAVTHAVLFVGYGLFKAGVIGNAGLVVYGAVVGFTPIILAALASGFFKPELLRPVSALQGSTLIGVLVKLTFGRTNLLRLDLAFIMQFGSAVSTRLIVLGRLSSVIPTDTVRVVQLNLDAVGVFDFSAGTAALDAVLVDSKLCGRFPLTGAAASLVAAGGDPTERLRKAKEMLDNGLITDAEFESIKARVVDGL